MAKYFKIKKEGDVLRIGFGKPAQNNQIVRDAVGRLNEMVKNKELMGGSLIKINGAASLPVVVAIAHGIGHLYKTVAVFDPKLGRYVVAVSHGDQYCPGDLID